MKFALFLVFAIVAWGCVRAPTAPASHPSTLAPFEVPLWPGAPPDGGPSGPERTTRPDSFVAGRPWTAVTDVARPSLTFYPPTAPATGAAVVVFPGGGYKELAIDLEGTEVCDWLVARGIACVLLKYRVPYTGPYWDDACKCRRTPPAPLALQDAQRAIGIIRHRASEWHVDPHRIGVLGFSAGGHLVAAASTHGERAYPAVDAADRERVRPDFAVALYPGHLWDEEARDLAGDIVVTAAVPPTFLLHAENDPVDEVEHSLVYHAALRRAGVPVEMHVFADGGHAFGLRRTTLPITRWPELVEAWLHTLGVLDGRAGHEVVAEPIEVAITVDDLPLHGPDFAAIDREAIAERLLAAFRAHHLPPVYGFVNGKTVDEHPETLAILRRWTAAGNPLGNHTYSHPSLTASSVEDYLADLEKGEAVLRGLEPAESTWHVFRYPFLFEGDTLEKREAVRRYLGDHHYAIAEVSIDGDDWAWNPPFARCTDRHDAAALAELRRGYVATHLDELRYMRTVTRELAGHPVKQVLLLHVGAADADAIDDLLTAYEREGVRWIDLPTALSDPFYAIDPHRPWRAGAAFPYAVARARGVTLPPPPPRPQEEKLATTCK